ncbi:MAG: hypothetical protein FWC43_01020, partial [Planctomycetaceae bacterium]|nr:hypothetical protein [Planctomycetaceae bacterium]
MPDCFKFLLVLILILTSRVEAADVVRLSEEGARSLVGTITEISATEVRILRTGSNTPTPVAAPAISATQFDQEPPTLTAMRSAFTGSRFSDLLETAQKLDPATIANPFARQDYDFFKAYALGQIALEGIGNRANLQKAMTACTDFLKTHPKSYHYFPVCELTGELSLVAGNREDAFQAFSLFAKAPWPVSQLKANTMLGTIRLEENRLDDAKKFYEIVLASQESSKEALRPKTEAEIGLAKCLIRKGDWKTAIERLDTLSVKTDSENARLQAAIYLALGEAYEAAENPKEAILAYLHVEILFPSAKPQYAAALKRLAVLWNKVNRPER